MFMAQVALSKTQKLVEKERERKKRNGKKTSTSVSLSGSSDSKVLVKSIELMVFVSFSASNPF